jgi:hypothetical protein
MAWCLVKHRDKYVYVRSRAGKYNEIISEIFFLSFKMSPFPRFERDYGVMKRKVGPVCDINSFFLNYSSL